MASEPPDLPKVITLAGNTAQERQAWEKTHSGIVDYAQLCVAAPKEFGWEGGDEPLGVAKPAARRGGGTPPPETSKDDREPSKWGGYQPERHLAYALLWELTGAPEIFRRVLCEFADGERLGVPDAALGDWLYQTEMRFYTPVSPPEYNLTSDIRPNARDARWRAYYRLLGADLGLRGRPAVGANTEFPAVADQMLEELRTAIATRARVLDQGVADDSRIGQLAGRLKSMLAARRRGGNLKREETAAVAQMTWFENALRDGSPVVSGLALSGGDAADRLAQLAARVGLTASPHSEDLIALARPLEGMLLLIERYDFDKPDLARGLYLVPVLSDSIVSKVILRWPALRNCRPHLPSAV